MSRTRAYLIGSRQGMGHHAKWVAGIWLAVALIVGHAAPTLASPGGSIGNHGDMGSHGSHGAGQKSHDDDRDSEESETDGGRASENVIRDATNAFGRSIGGVAIGLYGSGSVRGFSPGVAGNIRIEGLYFDEQNGLSSRVMSGSVVRLGANVLTNPFASPTGVINLSLRDADDEGGISPRATFGPFGQYGFQVDMSHRFEGSGLEVAGGASTTFARYGNGGSGHPSSFGGVIHYHPDELWRITAFWDRGRIRNETAPPTYIPDYEGLPPRVDRGHYNAPDWLLHDGYGDNMGIIGEFTDKGWQFKFGVFRSLSYSNGGFGNIINVLHPSGNVYRTVNADPSSRFRSYSGELRVSRAFSGEYVDNILTASIRGRDVNDRYGGGSRIALGYYGINEEVNVQKPPLHFHEQSHNHIGQYALGVSYGLRVGDGFNMSMGVQRTKYRKNQSGPNYPARSRQTMTWLPNASIDWRVTPNVDVFANYSEGLEENGQAPTYATNRLQVLPALKSKQYAAGVQINGDHGTDLVADYFWIEKPYFGLAEDGYYGNLGQVEHKGFEVSLSQEFGDALKVIVGGYYMDPIVSVDKRASGSIGKRAVGQPRVIGEIDANYVVPQSEHWSLDASVNFTGRRPGDVANNVHLGGFTTFRIGTRYRFDVGDANGVVRLEIQNLSNKYAWLGLGSGAYEPLEQRSISGYIAVDF